MTGPVSGLTPDPPSPFDRRDDGDLRRLIDEIFADYAAMTCTSKDKRCSMLDHLADKPRHPTSEVRCLIARYNAMLRVRDKEFDLSAEDLVWEFQAEAA